MKLNPPNQLLGLDCLNKLLLLGLAHFLSVLRLQLVTLVFLIHALLPAFACVLFFLFVMPYLTLSIQKTYRKTFSASPFDSRSSCIIPVTSPNLFGS